MEDIINRKIKILIALGVPENLLKKAQWYKFQSEIALERFCNQLIKIYS